MTTTPAPCDVTPALTARMEALYTRYRTAIHGYIRKRVFDDALADDLTQDVFLHAWTALPTLRGDASYSAWLYQIARNAAIDSGRTQRTRARLGASISLDDLLDMASYDPADPYAGGDPERMALIAEAISEIHTLSAEIPTLIWSAFALWTAGYDTTEIADALNSKSAVSAKMLVYRGRKLFTALYQQRYGESEVDVRHQPRRKGVAERRVPTGFAHTQPQGEEERSD